MNRHSGPSAQHGALSRIRHRTWNAAHQGTPTVQRARRQRHRRRCGALASVAGAGSLVVASVETAGDGSVVAESAGKASSATLALSGRAARDASLVVGASVEMVALSTGYLLVTAGRVLAFMPNEAGRRLLHSSRDRGRRPARVEPCCAPSAVPCAGRWRARRHAGTACATSR